jgi:hypothetical protein
MLIMAYSVDGGLQYGAGCITVLKVPFKVNPLKAELNPICHLLALLGAHHILHISRIRVKVTSSMYVLLLCFRKVVWDV